MPTIAISGRWRFGGFKAAIVASASSCAIGGAAPAAGAGGSERIQAPPIVTRSAATPKPLHKTSRLFMAPWPDVSSYVFDTETRAVITGKHRTYFPSPIVRHERQGRFAGPCRARWRGLGVTFAPPYYCAGLPLRGTSYLSSANPGPMARAEVNDSGGKAMRRGSSGLPAPRVTDPTCTMISSSNPAS